MIGRAVGFLVRMLVVGWLISLLEPLLLALLPVAVIAIMLQHLGVLIPS